MNYTYMRAGAAQGWQCPICQRVLSPWTQECPCKGKPESTITTTSTNTDDKPDSTLSWTEDTLNTKPNYMNHIPTIL